VHLEVNLWVLRVYFYFSSHPWSNNLGFSATWFWVQIKCNVVLPNQMWNNSWKGLPIQYIRTLVIFAFTNLWLWDTHPFLRIIKYSFLIKHIIQHLGIPSIWVRFGFIFTNSWHSLPHSERGSEMKSRLATEQSGNKRRNKFAIWLYGAAYLYGGHKLLPIVEMHAPLFMHVLVKD
jgi:hypothetical protein